ncbi:MAG: PAS domain-containing protein [Methyloprofundus sp.]|nr:PAS domain-containing protein [Methyloprofundus sp.]
MKADNSLNLFHWLRCNLLVICGTMILGYVGTLFSVPPSTASPIWPPAGLALAVMLVYGKPVLPGLVLGNLLLNFYSFLDFSSPESMQPALIAAAIITSLGLCLQASLGAYLINHFLGKQNPLIKDSKIIYFFLLAAPISSVVSATIGIASIFFQGYISVEEVLISWLIWWTGDCIGVIIFTPIILAFIAKPKKIWKVRRKLVSYPLLIMFILVAVLFQYNQQQESNRVAAVFERQVNKFHFMFNSEILHHVEINQVLKGYFDSSQYITEKEFDIFTRPFLDKKHNIQALEWISYITAEQRQQFESAAHGNLIMREPNQQNQMVPVTERAEYYPITYVQPMQKNQRAIGFDVGVNSIALKALMAAKVSGETVITESLQLVQDFERKTGFVLYSPVYYKASDAGDRAKNLKGYAAMVFRIDDEVQKIILDFPDVQLFIKIQDRGSKLYSNYLQTKITDLNLLSLQMTKQIQVANRIWTIIYQPSADFYLQQLSWTTWWLFLGGFAFTSLMSMGLLMLSGRTLRTEELVRSRTQDLAESEERWQFALKGNRQGVWDWNVLSSEVFFSTSWKAMLGYAEQEVGNSADDWYKRLHPDDKEQAYAKLEIYFNKGTSTYENEQRMLCRDGSYKWVVGRGMVVAWTDDQKPLRMIGTMTDITEQRQTEEALRRAQKMDAVGQLTGGIAHDFNNILNIILGNAELLSMTLNMDEKARKRLNTITKSAERAASLTKQLLSFTRNKAVKVTRTNINTVLLEMGSMINRSVTPEVEVEHLFAEDLWFTEIDQGDFEDVVLNLIINARDAMAGSGELVLETENHTLDAKYCASHPGVQAGDYVQLTVSDNGEGIAAEQLEHIFEPFFTTKPQGKGTGLGLSMAFGFCQRSKGYINVYSELGIGTTFRINLPRAKRLEQNPEQTNIQTEPLPEGNETILVVDDEEDLLEILRVSLEGQGYTVVMANNAKQALEQLVKEPKIDLLFTDVVMPGGINGFQLAEQAKAKYPDLKILIASGFTQKVAADDNQLYLNANLLSKPYSQAEVIRRMRVLLDSTS